MSANLAMGELTRHLTNVALHVREFVTDPEVLAANPDGGRRLIELIEQMEQSLTGLRSERRITSDIAGSMGGRGGESGSAWTALLLRRLNEGLEKALMSADRGLAASQSRDREEVEVRRERVKLKAESKETSISWRGQAFKLFDALQYLSAAQRNGELEIESASGDRIWLYVKQGQLVGAASRRPRPGLRLGDILIEQGAIGKGKLHEVLSDHSDSSKPLGQILLMEGLVDQEQLGSALEHQMMAFFDVSARLTPVKMKFIEGQERKIPDDAEFRIDLNWLTLEQARISDEETVS